MNTKIIVDRDRCIGAGLCTMAPSYFDLGDDGKVELPRGGDVADDDVGEVNDAVMMCPAEALRLQVDS